MAENSTQFQYKFAEIKLHEKFFNTDELDQVEILVHELIHCHMGFYRPVTQNFINNSGAISTTDKNRFNQAMVDNEEESTEMIAKTFTKEAFKIYKKIFKK